MSDQSPQTIDEKETLASQLKSFMRLWPYLWPKDKPSYKLRTFVALIFTIMGQFILVGAPFFLGRSVDAVRNAQETHTVWADGWMFIAALIFGYGGLRLLSVMISEVREYLFAPVGQYAQRQVATATFKHLHNLSLRYHLERRMGGLSRIIERGIRSIDFLFGSSCLISARHCYSSPLQALHFGWHLIGVMH